MYINLVNQFHYINITKGIEILAKRLFPFSEKRNDMYMSFKGIGKILFVSVLRILLICKFLNFLVTFTKKIKLPFNFLREKVNFSLIHRTRMTIRNYIQTKVEIIRYF